MTVRTIAFTPAFNRSYKCMIRRILMLVLIQKMGILRV
jgi:hypothetical protein